MVYIIVSSGTKESNKGILRRWWECHTQYSGELKRIMKTNCFCIGCKKHPMHSKRTDCEWITGFFPGDWIGGETGETVDCLSPESDAFDLFDIDPSNFEFRITAYCDGSSMTGFNEDGIRLEAYCENEQHED